MVIINQLASKIFDKAIGHNDNFENEDDKINFRKLLDTFKDKCDNDVNKYLNELQNDKELDDFSKLLFSREAINTGECSICKENVEIIHIKKLNKKKAICSYCFNHFNSLDLYSMSKLFNLEQEHICDICNKKSKNIIKLESKTSRCYVCIDNCLKNAWNDFYDHYNKNKPIYYLNRGFDFILIEKDKKTDSKIIYEALSSILNKKHMKYDVNETKSYIYIFTNFKDSYKEINSMLFIQYGILTKYVDYKKFIKYLRYDVTEYYIKINDELNLQNIRRKLHRDTSKDLRTYNNYGTSDDLRRKYINIFGETILYFNFTDSGNFGKWNIQMTFDDIVKKYDIKWIGQTYSSDLLEKIWYEI